MLVEKSMHPDWLSNAFLVAAEGGPAVFVDSGADVAPLIEAVERGGVTPGALLRTHGHHDHVENEDELARRYSIPVLAEPGEWKWDGLQVQALTTPGHSDDGLSFVIDDGVVATGDTLFRDAVGGGDVAAVRRADRFSGAGWGGGAGVAVRGRLWMSPSRWRTTPRACRGTPTKRRSDASAARTPSSASGAAPRRREASEFGSEGATRRSSSGRPTTTATARHGFASTTAKRRPSAGRASNAPPERTCPKRTVGCAACA